MQLALSGLDKPEYRPNIAIVVITIIVNAILIFFNTEPLIIIIITTTFLASLPSGPREAWLLTKYLIASSSPIYAEIFSQSPVLLKKKQLFSKLQEFIIKTLLLVHFETFYHYARSTKMSLVLDLS